MTIEQAKTILGDPFYETSGILVYNMDCREGLVKLANQNFIFDTTITSPPYNIGKEYESNMSVDNYISWLTNIIGLTHDVTKDNGALLLNVGYLKMKNIARAIPIPYLIWDKIKFYLVQEIIWKYGAGVACKRYLSPRNEKVLWYIKNELDYTFNLDPIRDKDVKYPNQKKNGRLRCNPLGKNPSDVWEIRKVTSGKNRSSKERMPHPAQFPEELITRCMLAFSNKNEIILDPFMGSGTTAAVALRNGRQCIGFEISELYCNTIVERLENVLKVLEINEMSPQLF